MTAANNGEKPRKPHLDGCGLQGYVSLLIQYLIIDAMNYSWAPHS